MRLSSNMQIYQWTILFGWANQQGMETQSSVYIYIYVYIYMLYIHLSVDLSRSICHVYIYIKTCAATMAMDSFSGCQTSTG